MSGVPSRELRVSGKFPISLMSTQWIMPGAYYNCLTPSSLQRHHIVRRLPFVPHQAQVAAAATPLATPEPLSRRGSLGVYVARSRHTSPLRSAVLASRLSSCSGNRENNFRRSHIMDVYVGNTFAPTPCRGAIAALKSWIGSETSSNWKLPHQFGEINLSRLRSPSR